MAYVGPPSPASSPRILVLGSYRDALGLDASGLLDALAASADLRHLDASAAILQTPAVLRRAARSITRDRLEMLHVLDARLAPAAALIQRRYRLPVSVTVTRRDVAGRGPWSRLALRALARFDQAFSSDDAAVEALRTAAWRLPISLVGPAARELPWPDKRDLARVSRALRGVRPGRLVIGVPWPRNRNDFRWFRDVVQPGLEARPLCLLFGVPGRRDAALMLRATRVEHDYRILPGRVDASTIAAIARAVDAFAVPPPSVPAHDGRTTAMSLALAVSGAPVVSGAGAAAPVLAHERNALVAEPGDERGFVASLNQLLALPAVQRHFLGEEFARFTLQRWPWSDVAEVYVDRFAALVGRPRIPAGLRAA